MTDTNNQPQSLKPAKKYSKRKKWLVILIAVFTLFILGAVSAWIYISFFKPSSTSTNTTNSTTDKVILDAQKLANTGKVGEAVSSYDNAIKATNDSAQKAILLENKATALFNSSKYDEALTAALASESSSENAVITQLIAQIYEKTGDKKKAIEYYQKTISLYDKTVPTYTDDIQYFQYKISSLGGVNG